VDFAEIVEVFRILARWRDEERAKKALGSDARGDDAPEAEGSGPFRSPM